MTPEAMQLSVWGRVRVRVPLPSAAAAATDPSAPHTRRKFVECARPAGWNSYSVGIVLK